MILSNNVFIEKKNEVDRYNVRVLGEFDPPKELRFCEEVTLLTKSEQTIMVSLLEGRSNKEIAYRRKLSTGTVRNHLDNITNKLRSKGYDIPKRPGSGARRRIVLALLHSGDLELRNPKY